MCDNCGGVGHYWSECVWRLKPQLQQRWAGPGQWPQQQGNSWRWNGRLQELGDEHDGAGGPEYVEDSEELCPDDVDAINFGELAWASEADEQDEEWPTIMESKGKKSRKRADRAGRGQEVQRVRRLEGADGIVYKPEGLELNDLSFELEEEEQACQATWRKVAMEENG